MQAIEGTEVHKVKEKEIFMRKRRLEALPSEILTEEGEKQELCGLPCSERRQIESSLCRVLEEQLKNEDWVVCEFLSSDNLEVRMESWEQA